MESCNSVCKGERCSLFRLVHVGADVGLSTNYCMKMMKEGSELAKNFLLQLLWDIHQSEPL